MNKTCVVVINLSGAASVQTQGGRTSISSGLSYQGYQSVKGIPGGA